MKKRIFFLMFGFVLMVAGLSAQQAKTYCNNRFGFCVNYPDMLKPASDGPANGDGIILEGEEGINVSISGSFNVMGWTPQRIYEFALEDLTADLGTEVKPVGPRIDTDGFEARFSTDEVYQYARMWSLGDTYLIINISGPKAASEKIETLKDRIATSFGS